MQNGANGSDSLTSGEEKEVEKTTVQPANPAGVGDRGGMVVTQTKEGSTGQGIFDPRFDGWSWFASIALWATVPILQQIPEGCLKYHVSSSIRVLMMAQTDKAPGSFFKSLTKELPG